jgi:uncharacterized protein
VLAASGSAALESLFARYARADVYAAGATPFGPLRPTADVDGTRTILSLPPGFQYRIVSIAGRTMSDGNVVPPNGDGMAAFPDGGFIRLVRNHERTGPGLRLTTSGPHYDGVATGGTITVVVDPSTRRVVRDFVSLSGTAQNCFGGRTPWGSWLSGEETTVGPDQGFEKPHGYVFEVPAAANGPVEAVPLTGMGRFAHEAAVVDPRTSAVYLTEDASSCGFYRHLPHEAGRLAAGGRLQMLAVDGRPRYDTGTRQRQGVRLPVVWVDILNPDPAVTAFDQQPVYRQGFQNGGATFVRLEGGTYVNGSIYFISTTGGDRGLGQLWQYRPDFDERRRAVGGARVAFTAPETKGHLTLVYESRDPEILRLPDNICPTPNGGLVICEDSGQGFERVRMYSPRGELFDFAANIMPGEERSELSGPTFSPDGQTLFFNIYSRAVTVAVWGPWRSDLI